MILGYAGYKSMTLFHVVRHNADCSKYAHNQIRYPSYSLHTHLRLFLEKMSTREPLSEQLNQPSVAYTMHIIQRICLRSIRDNLIVAYITALNIQYTKSDCTYNTMIYTYVSLVSDNMISSFGQNVSNLGIVCFVLVYTPTSVLYDITFGCGLINL